jgi:hypothetical protein
MPNDLTLLYGKKPIRAQLDHGSLWFAAADLYAANRLYTDRGCLARMAPEHLRLATFPGEAGASIRLTAVTPLGALTIARWLPGSLARIMAAWVRRKTNRLAGEHGFPPLGIELLADWTVPPNPRPRDVEDYLAWKDLDLRHVGLRRRPPDYSNPALADEDPNVAPDRGEAARDSILGLMAAGEAAMAREAAART